MVRPGGDLAVPAWSPAGWWHDVVSARLTPRPLSAWSASDGEVCAMRRVRLVTSRSVIGRFSMILAPLRRVIFAPGQRLMAAAKVALARRRSSWRHHPNGAVFPFAFGLLELTARTS